MLFATRVIRTVILSAGFFLRPPGSPRGQPHKKVLAFPYTHCEHRAGSPALGHRVTQARQSSAWIPSNTG